jgi:UDP-N-acetylmuramate: L-alanyl-gamma-D-glutamyl-meso-diaminopimelate ligase
LNNLEFDHADIFDDLAAIERQFHHLVRIVPSSGLLVVNGSDSALEQVLTKGVWTPVEHFAVPAGWEASAPNRDGSFEIKLNGEAIGRLQWNLLGEHNRTNALAAIAAARHVGVAPAQAIEALARFSGVRRRLQARGEAGGVGVHDDFAHHPTAIRVTLEALRERIGQARLLAVLEPRSNTMKRGVMKEALPESLALADRVYVYTAGLGWDAAAVFGRLGARARCSDKIDALIETIAADARPGDHVLIMSNGGFGGIQHRLLERLRERAAA